VDLLSFLMLGRKFAIIVEDAHHADELSWLILSKLQNANISLSMFISLRINRITTIDHSNDPTTKPLHVGQRMNLFNDFKGVQYCSLDAPNDDLSSKAIKKQLSKPEEVKVWCTMKCFIPSAHCIRYCRRGMDCVFCLAMH
jgi:hypothetical protein